MNKADTLTLADGRTLCFAQWGDPDGRPIVSIHGTPGSRLNRHHDESTIAAAGARLITYDRPGYGGSTRAPGRIVNDCVADVVELINSLGIGRFAVVGGSGGGPHSLAVAAGLPQRITRAACVVGIAPYDVLGEQWLAGMDPQNVKEFGWALAGEATLRVELRNEADGMLERIAADPGTVLGEFEIPDSDREILGRPDVASVMREAMTASVGSSVDGWIDDDIAFTKPWGFDPATISVPTTVWWGALDVLVPPRHGEWLARTVPDATPRVASDGGHQADPDTYVDEMYGWLLDGRMWDD
jgi:pimeloyl-ACP methyl ester carboxylesterase